MTAPALVEVAAVGAMLAGEINRLLLARRIATVNGKLVLEVRV